MGYSAWALFLTTVFVEVLCDLLPDLSSFRS